MILLRVDWSQFLFVRCRINWSSFIVISKGFGVRIAATALIQGDSNYRHIVVWCGGAGGDRRRCASVFADGLEAD